MVPIRLIHSIILMNFAGSISRGSTSADGDGGSKLVVTLLLSSIPWNDLFDTGSISRDSKYADGDAFPFSISSTAAAFPLVVVVAMVMTMMVSIH